MTSLAIAAAAIAQPSYRLVDLGQIGYESHAFAIGPNRAVAGSFTNPAADFQAYLAASVPAPIPISSSQSQAVAFDVDATGHAIGTAYELGDLNWHAFSQNGSSMIDLGQFAARAVNAAGAIAGTANVTINSAAGRLVMPRASRWTNGSLQILPTLGGASAQGMTIDDAGRIAGSSWNANDEASRPCLWTGSVATDLGTLGGASGQVYSLRASVAVGMSSTSAGVAHATQWNLGPSGNVLSRVDLGAIGDGAASVAHATNAAGDAVGTSDQIAVLWHAGTPLDLGTRVNAPGWVLEDAWDIDDLGCIVGTGKLLGATHAFMLIPMGLSPVSGADFNLDGNVDLLWRNSVRNYVVAWNCDGTPATSPFVVGTQGFADAPSTSAVLVGRGDFNNDGVTDLLWRNGATGANTITFSAAGTSSTGELPAVAGPDWRLVGVGDFNSDGKSDVVWRNPKAGSTIIWLLNGTTVTQAVTLASVRERAWLPVGVGDFTGDSKDDILWRNQHTGDNTVWEMNGAVLMASRPLAASVADVNWQVGDVADFDGDSKVDIVWRNTLTGANSLWKMNGTTVDAAYALPSATDQAWQFAGMDDLEGTIKRDDFNNDGHADIFWRNVNTGDNVLWLMLDEDTIGSSASLPSVTSAQWSVVSIGDLNRDNMPDILWRNSSTGENIAWLMNATSLRGTVAIPGASTEWNVFAIADANGDKINDIYWRSTVNGAVSVWLLDGTPSDSTVVVGAMKLPGESALGWNPCGVDDIDRNGTPDIIWRNATDGSVMAWFMSGADIIRSTSLPTVSDLNWRIVKLSDMNDDGTPDVLWRNQSTGADSVWLLSNSIPNLYAGSVSPPSVTDTGWQVQGRIIVTP